MVGDSQPLSISALDAANQERNDITVTWASDNAGIVTVNPQGIVTAITPGTAAVTALSSGLSASIQIPVGRPPLAKLEIQPSVISLTPGGAQQLQLIATESKDRELKGQPVNWESNNPRAATVDEEGRVTAEGSGTATITATAGDKSASVRVTVLGPGPAKLEIHPDAASVGKITGDPTSVIVKAPETAAGKSLNDELKDKYKAADPSQLVYLSGITGEIAGTGDPTKFAGEAEQAGLSEHPLALELADLPKDRYGLIDWAAAIKTGKVKPRYTLDSKAAPDEPPLRLDVVVFTKSQFMDDVIFPHYVHTLWLTCTNCHPALFPMNAKEANKMMTMPRIAAGEFCGRCHNRIAFPLSDCLRCHVKPKDTPPIDPNYQSQATGKTP